MLVSQSVLLLVWNTFVLTHAVWCTGRCVSMSMSMHKLKTYA